MQNLGDLRIELDAAKIWKNDYQAASASIVEFEKVVSELQRKLAEQKVEKEAIIRKTNEEKENIEEVSSFSFSVPIIGRNWPDSREASGLKQSYSFCR